MKMKFNRMERIAGLFVLLSMTGTLFAAVGIVVKKGFFEPKVRFFTFTKSSNSIRPGTPVQLAGLRAGSVSDIELGTDGQVKVEFVIFRKYLERIHADSRLQLNRPSLLSERVLEITMGTEASAPARPDSVIRMDESEDAIDVLSGKRLSALLEHVDEVLVESAGAVKQIAHGKNLEQLVHNLRSTSDEIRKSVRGDELGNILANMSRMSTEFAALSGQLKHGTQNLPDSVRKVDELLAETTVMVKGIQRSFLFRGGVKDVREEEAEKADKEKALAKETKEKDQAVDRAPAGGLLK
jgi:phospholipid/cholesterol/gamma-HCH transport system substrate-binding protein